MNGGKVPSHAEIAERLCAPGHFFEIQTVEVSGIATRVWRHAPRCLPDVLEQGSSNGGDRDFIRLGDERLTHAGHYAQVTALAVRLRDELGVAKGDHVAIAMRNLPEWSVAFFAATMIGAVAVPLNSMWNGAEMAFGIADSRASVLIADGERLERLAPHVAGFRHLKVIGTRLEDRKGTGELSAGITSLAALTDGARVTRPEVDIAPDDHATIFYTSGTTGGPKGVLGTHRNICTNLISLMYSEETASTFTEGWLHSGDIGRIDEQGRLFIVDRAKDIIIRGGENISSLEVESALYQHPAVLEAAAFAAPHATLGEEVAAVLRLRPGHTVSRAELREFLLGLLAPFKVPAHIWFVKEPMPRSPSGKLLKRELRRRFVAEPATAGGA